MNLKMKQSIIKALKSIKRSLPLILGSISLVSLISAIIPKSFYGKAFSQSQALNSVIGSMLGSISAGSPITSYIISGELLKQGVGLIAVTSFLVAWVTVGLIQIPAESSILGKKFAILRNVSSFILSILVAIITVFIVKII